ADLRPRRASARQGHLQADRGRDAVPRPHQGGGDPRDARGRSGEEARGGPLTVLGVGDVVGDPGRRAVHALLPKLRKQYEVDLAVVNVENAAAGFGVAPEIARAVLADGEI